MKIEEVAMRWPDLMDYWIAPGNQGPHAGDWADKPHRLIYNLICKVADARERAESAEKYTQTLIAKLLAVRADRARLSQYLIQKEGHTPPPSSCAKCCGQSCRVLILSNSEIDSKI